MGLLSIILSLIKTDTDLKRVLEIPFTALIFKSAGTVLPSLLVIVMCVSKTRLDKSINVPRLPLILNSKYLLFNYWLIPILMGK